MKTEKQNNISAVVNTESTVTQLAIEVDSAVAKLIRYGLALFMVVVMIGLSEYLQEKEVVFPEIAALVIGGWISIRQPWNVSKLKMVVLISISSVLGVLLVQSNFFPLYIQVLIGFAFCGVCLTLAQSTFVPMISACILPVLMETESWIYPLSVFVMTIIIALIQLVLESAGLRTKRETIPQPDTFSQLKRWGLLLVVLAVLSAIPVVLLKDVFYIAPPLIVAYVELSSPASPVRKKPLAVWLLLCVAALIGAFGRILICETLGMSLTTCSVCIMLIMFIIMEKVKIFFPPAGAICLLPLIIPASSLMGYPLQVITGSGVLICAAMLLGKSNSTGAAETGAVEIEIDS